MTSHPIATCLCACLVLTGLTTTSRAITAAELSRKLKAGEVVQLIDLRPKSRFETGTIPGAMSIPSSIIIEKKLPPLSPAVLFDDGLGSIDVAAIAATLNQRPGWKAEVLEGGFAAWTALSDAPQTSPVGLHTEHVQHITFEDLAALKENVVLVDLRPVDPVTAGTKAKAAMGKKPASTSTPDPVTAFCGRAQNRSYLRDLDGFRKRYKPTNRPANMGLKAPGSNNEVAATPPLVVLINAVNADTRETARRLRSEGYTRLLILAGGDESIQLEGRRGKGRISGTVGQGTFTEPTPQSKPATPAKP
jgi:rhodanese-related sulfurtransferase